MGKQARIFTKDGKDKCYLIIFTIQYPVPLFSLCTKSLIAVFKDVKKTV